MKTPRNMDYLKYIRTQPCCQCGIRYNIHAHHTETGGMGIKASDYSCVPMCSNCHTILHDTTRKDNIRNVQQIIARLLANYKGETHGIHTEV
jgi:hypothetical protein